MDLAVCYLTRSRSAKGVQSGCGLTIAHAYFGFEENSKSKVVPKKKIRPALPVTVRDVVSVLQNDVLALVSRSQTVTHRSVTHVTAVRNSLPGVTRHQFVGATAPLLGIPLKRTTLSHE